MYLYASSVFRRFVCLKEGLGHGIKTSPFSCGPHCLTLHSVNTGGSVDEAACPQSEHMFEVYVRGIC